MSLKLVLVFASMALASSAHIDLNEHLANQMQKQIDINNFQNERIREHQELTHQQRQLQIEQLNEQKRVQDQMIRDHQQERIDHARENHHYNIQVFNPHHHQKTPSVFHVQPTIVHIPSATRHVNVHDDSNYNFRYAVSDMTTGDIKSHQETRHGDEVQGQYTMMDSDGYQRTVNYRANDRDGFDAEVRREPSVVLLALPAQYNLNTLHGFTNYPGHHNQHNFNEINTQVNKNDQWTGN